MLLKGRVAKSNADIVDRLMQALIIQDYDLRELKQLSMDNDL
jgi:uncharacterized protein (DUF849 family)